MRSFGHPCSTSTGMFSFKTLLTLSPRTCPPCSPDCPRPWRGVGDLPIAAARARAIGDTLRLLSAEVAPPQPEAATGQGRPPPESRRRSGGGTGVAAGCDDAWQVGGAVVRPPKVPAAAVHAGSCRETADDSWAAVTTARRGPACRRRTTRDGLPGLRRATQAPAKEPGTSPASATGASDSTAATDSTSNAGGFIRGTMLQANHTRTAATTSATA